MEAILFIESARTGSSSEAFTAANRLGYSSILLTKRKYFFHQKEELPLNTQVTYVEHIDEVTIRNTIKEFLQLGYTLRAVMSFVDPYVSIATAFSNQFCQSDISYEALRLIENKSETRKALAMNSASLDYEVISSTDVRPSFFETKRCYPKIVKKSISNGSKDVLFVENDEQLQAAVRKLIIRNANDQLIIEDYIEGTQYNIELLVCRGMPIIIAIVKQEITRNVTFIVTGYEICMNMESQAYKDLWCTVREIVRAIDLQHGTCHMEMRHSVNGWKLIEINPRPSGGAMNRMVEEAYGINIVEETIKLYVGQEPDLIKKKKQPVYTSYITISRMGYLLRIEGIEQAVKSPGIVEFILSSKIGSTMIPALSMGYRYGYVMANGNSQEEAKFHAEHAASLLKFYLEPIE